MKRCNDEAILQEHFCHWLDAKGILFNASMAGVYLGILAAVRKKKMGAKKGFPDLFIYQKSDDGKYAGLAIELKTETGHTSPEQISWQQELTKQGYLALIMPKLDFNLAYRWLTETVENYLLQSIHSEV